MSLFDEVEVEKATDGSGLAIATHSSGLTIKGDLHKGWPLYSEMQKALDKPPKLTKIANR